MGEALRYVLFYENGDLSLAAEHFPAHKSRYTDFMARGALLSLGRFTDGSGSIAVFATREGAEEFAAGDPLVLHGVVSAWRSGNGAKLPPYTLGLKVRRKRPHGRRPRIKADQSMITKPFSRDRANNPSQPPKPS
jgi:uncharacterized protein